MKTNGLTKEQFEIIRDLKLEDWSEHAPLAREILNWMTLDFIKSERIDGMRTEDREDVSFMINLLQYTISRLEDLDKSGKIVIPEDLPIISDNSGEVCQECLKKEGIIELLEEQIVAKEARIKELCQEFGRKKNCKTIPINEQ